MNTRESRYVTVARIAYQLAQATMPSYWHRKSPHRFTVPQLAACVMVAYYMKLSYRDMEEWLLASDKVCQALELKEIPDHSTLNRAFHRLRMRNLDQMNQKLLEELQVEEDAIGVDSTGYSLSEASVYYQTRSGRVQREFIKGAYAIGTRSQLILCWRQGRAPSGDARLLNALRRGAHRYGRVEGRRHVWVLLADGGFDGKMARPDDLIPPRWFRGAYHPSPERQARRELVDAARLDGLFGQRWKCETVFSVIKRKLGDTIRSRLLTYQLRESALKGLVYNIHVQPFLHPA